MTMVCIYKGTYSEVINLKNILENKGINSFIINELMSTIEPWAVTSGGLNPFELSIHEQDFEKAKIEIDLFNNETVIE
jgi:hypothetical protein